MAYLRKSLRTTPDGLLALHKWHIAIRPMLRTPWRSSNAANPNKRSTSKDHNEQHYLARKEPHHPRAGKSADGYSPAGNRILMHLCRTTHSHVRFIYRRGTKRTLRKRIAAGPEPYFLPNGQDPGHAIYVSTTLNQGGLFNEVLSGKCNDLAAGTFSNSMAGAA